MAFIGAINQQLRKFFGTHARILEGRKIYVGCSGNFTIESVLSARCGRVDIYSNDVSLYSSAIGHMLTGRQLPVEVVDPALAWLNDYIRRGAAEQVATLQLLLTMLEHEKRNNAFRVRMWEAYAAQFDKLFEKTLAKVVSFRDSVRIRDYTMIDVFDFFPRADGVCVGFLPTYVGGYEKLFKAFDAAVRWDSPSYGLLTTERRLASIEKMTQGDFLLYDDTERDLPCIAEVAKPGKRAVYIYSNLPFPGALVRPRASEKTPHFEVLSPEEEIPADAPVVVRQVDLATLNHYRNLYLSKRIVPGAGGLCYLVFVGGKLIGAMMFQTYSVKLKSRTEIYLMSDFVVPSTRHPRLSKLLLMITLSQDTRRMLEKREIKRFESILTSVFTDKPISMKYRGLYELVKRGETGDGKPFLNYRGTFSATTYQEVIPAWKSKYDKR